MLIQQLHESATGNDTASHSDAAADTQAKPRHRHKTTPGASSSPSQSPTPRAVIIPPPTTSPLASESPSKPSETKTSGPETPGTFKITMVHANEYTHLPKDKVKSDMQILINSGSERPDFVTLNEAWHPRSWYTLGPYKMTRLEKNRYSQETPVMWDSSKWKIIDSGTELLHDVDIKGGTRYANYGVFALRSTIDSDSPLKVSVISAHQIQAPRAGPKRFAQLVKGTEGLVELVEQLPDDSVKLIGCDCNIHMPASNRLPYPLTKLHQVGVYSTYEPQGLGLPKDWHTGKGPGKGNIDYQFYERGQGLIPIEQHTINNTQSDHRAVKVVYNYNARRS